MISEIPRLVMRGNTRSEGGSKRIKIISGASPLEQLDLQNFEGNAQGLRVLTQLEGHLFDGGRRPTFATLGTFIKYPWSSGHAVSIQKQKFGFFQSEKEHIEEIASELGLIPKGGGSWVRHPLVYLVEAADDICYAIIDLEDALEVGILDFGEVEPILLNGLNPAEADQYQTICAKDLPRRLSYLRGKVVDYLVREVIDVFQEEEDSILNGEFDDDLISGCGEPAKNIVNSAKNLASKKVFHQPRKTQIEIGAYSIIDVLLTALCDANSEFKERTPSFKAQRVFDLLGVNAPDQRQEPYQSLIRITDFVSGSTDKYAAQLSRRLIGWIFDPYRNSAAAEGTPSQGRSPFEVMRKCFIAHENLVPALADGQESVPDLIRWCDARRHPLSVAAARTLALQNADVVFLMGARFNWIFHFGQPPRYAPDVKVIQLDIAPEEIGHNKATEVRSTDP